MTTMMKIVIIIIIIIIIIIQLFYYQYTGTTAMKPITEMRRNVRKLHQITNDKT